MKIIIVAFLFLVVTGCGNSVCVLGLGDCSALKDSNQPANPTQPQDGTTLTLTSTSASVAQGNTLILTIAGGTKPYKSCAVTDGKGEPSLIEEFKCKFVASTTPGTVIIRVTDSAGATADLAIKVY